MPRLKKGQERFNLVLEGEMLQMVHVIKAKIGCRTKTGAIRYMLTVFKDEYWNVLE